MPCQLYSPKERLCCFVFKEAQDYVCRSGGTKFRRAAAGDRLDDFHKLTVVADLNTDGGIDRGFTFAGP